MLKLGHKLHLYKVRLPILAVEFLLLLVSSCAMNSNFERRKFIVAKPFDYMVVIKSDSINDEFANRNVHKTESNGINILYNQNQVDSTKIQNTKLSDDSLCNEKSDFNRVKDKDQHEKIKLITNGIRQGLPIYLELEDGTYLLNDAVFYDQSNKLCGSLEKFDSTKVEFNVQIFLKSEGYDETDSGCVSLVNIGEVLDAQNKEEKDKQKHESALLFLVLLSGFISAIAFYYYKSLFDTVQGFWNKLFFKLFLLPLAIILMFIFVALIITLIYS